ncbi:exported hypothetical protein [Candidatus Nitrotoga sp. BS]|uniref:hypothetical protein n=1 Tax=Candidatus Nitrotoga sp. BS TaxID=2890408 RepID=UPI001EF19F96|nr:hypothetical protein [Candidatus Nitrotoga sp. BS]CAH1211293.1 exported hypothetical protein [Candidatus Nitrotoga sp. BS]
MTIIRTLTILTALMCLMHWTPAYSKPDVTSSFNVLGLQIFKDHQKRNTYYYATTQLELETAKQHPAFRYDLNRYMGKKETSDKQVFRVRGILSFAAKPTISASLYQQVREELAKQNTGIIEVLPAPVKKFQSHLVYLITGSDDVPDATGTIAGGVSTETAESKSSGTGWSKRSFTIALMGIDADLFWQSFEKGSMILSLAYNWEINGVKPENEGWVASPYQISGTLPIDVYYDDYPGLFSRNEIWQTMSLAHTHLTVACYDFINAIASGLYKVTVEVRFLTERDQEYVERVKFQERDEEYERIIKFRLPKNLQAGYDYRVQRIYVDGKIEQSEWMKHDDALLDVSLALSDISGNPQLAGESQ